MKVYDAPASGMSRSSATAAPARPSSPRRSCSTPAWSTASARSTTARPSPTTTKKRSPASTRSSASLAYAEWNKHKINLIDTPGHRQLPARRARGAAASPTPRWSSSTRSPASMVQTEKVWAGRRGARPAAPGRRQPARSRAREPRAHARVAARRRAAAPSIPIQLPIGEEKSFTRRRRSGGDEGLHVRRPTAAASSPKAPCPASMTDAARRRARGADRDGRRGRRHADGEVLRGRHADAGGAASPGCAARPSPARSSRWSARRRRSTSASSRCSTRSSPTCRRRPIGRSRRVDKAGDEVARDGGREGAGRRLRLEDDRRSVRRPHHDVPRRLRHAQGRLDRPQHDARTRPSGSATCCCCRARRRRTCRRSRPATSARSPS